MATGIGQRTHVGFRAPASFPVQSSIPFGQGNDPSQYLNQLQFNMNTPYSINSLASNFQKPQPLVIEKVPVTTGAPATIPVVPRSHRVCSPASSISSDRLHFAVQLAKMDAKKLKQHREMEQYEGNVRERRLDVGQTKKGAKSAVVHPVRNMQDVQIKQTNLEKSPRQKLQNRNRKDKEMKRNLHEFHLYPDASEIALPAAASDRHDKQTREIKRLERQMHKYLQRLDELIHKGQEVIQKKDKRLKRQHKDDVSHLSDEDTDPRQFERAQEQATRSARVLYMIERQVC